MKVLIDSNLPPQMAAWVEALGHEATHVDDVLPGSALDSDIWTRARDHGALIVTKDSDFRDRAVRDASVAVIWIRCGNLKLTTFRAWFERRQAAAFALADAGQKLIEMR